MEDNLTDEAKAEIAAAIRILRDDGLHVHKTYARYMKENGTPPAPDPAKTPPADPKAKPSVEGGPPPVKDGPPPEPPKPGKRSIWWGDRE